MEVATGALREGMLYDLLGRFHHHDMRERRSRIHETLPRGQPAGRAGRGARAAPASPVVPRPADQSRIPVALLAWAARLQEIGLSVAHRGYHKHSAYILGHADMPGFSKMEQAHLVLLVLAHRGKMEKMKGQITDSLDLAMVMALAWRCSSIAAAVMWPAPDGGPLRRQEV